MIIRQLKPEDIDSCIDAGREMHRESSYASIPFGENNLKNLAHLCLTDPDYVCFVGVENYEIIGMMVGAKTRYWFSEDAYYAADLALYVRKQFRGSSCAIRLIQAFMRWAKASNCIDIRCGVTTGINPEVAKRLYVDGFGFKDAGSLYIWRISPLTGYRS